MTIEMTQPLVDLLEAYYQKSGDILQIINHDLEHASANEKPALIERAIQLKDEAQELISKYAALLYQPSPALDTP
jgi:exopolysaccharide biosynthesis predicted pyruvyltransferase EpsI